jgi:Transposase
VELVVARCAGLDVAKDEVVACVRAPGGESGRRQEVRTFQTFTSGLEVLAELLEHGLLRGSFVPPAAIRELRDLTRYRKRLIQAHTAEVQRVQKTLEDAGIKLDSVAADVVGVSGRAMLAALVRGERDPQVLAELARGRLRNKLPQLRQALRGSVQGPSRPAGAPGP